MNSQDHTCCIHSHQQGGGQWQVHSGAQRHQPPSCGDPGCSGRCKSSQDHTCCIRSHQLGDRQGQVHSGAQRHQPPSCEDPGCSGRCKNSQDHTCCIHNHQQGGRQWQAHNEALKPLSCGGDSCDNGDLPPSCGDPGCSGRC